MNIALITVIESDRVNIDSHNTHHVRLFEQEAIRAFTSWRAHAGKLAHIDIYAVCITKNTISNTTKRTFDSLGVKYIEHYIEETVTFDCGFYNKPLGCAYLESILTHDYLIHIDLDMYTLREPQLAWRNSCMVYDPQQQPVERIHHRRTMPETYNTCLMVTKREDAIFTLWWEKLVWLTHDYNANRERYDLDYSNLDYRKLEELSFDLLSTEVNIYNIPNSIFGETYTRLNEMTDEEFQHVCFHHYHIYPRLSQYNWVKDIREWNARL